MIGYSDGKQDILNEAIEVGAGEYVDNYQTMTQDFQWIIVDEPRKYETR